MAGLETPPCISQPSAIVLKRTRIRHFFWLIFKNAILPVREVAFKRPEGAINPDAHASFFYSHCSSLVSMSSSSVSSSTTTTTQVTRTQLKPADSRQTCHSAALRPQHGFSQLELGRGREVGRSFETSLKVWSAKCWALFIFHFISV